MIVKHLKSEESNTPSGNELFGNRSRPRSRKLFRLNMFVISTVGSAYPQLDLHVRYFMTTNNRRLLLLRSFRSNLQAIRVISVIKYVALKQVGEAIWECTVLMSMSKRVILLITCAAELTMLNLAWSITCSSTSAFCSIVEMAFCIEVAVTIYIYICIYRERIIAWI